MLFGWLSPLRRRRAPDWSNPSELRVFHIGGYWRGQNDAVRQVMLGLRGAGALVHEYCTDEHPEALDCDGRGWDRGTTGPVWLRWEALKDEIEAFRPDLIVCDAGGLSFRPDVARRLRRRTALLGIAMSDPDVFAPTTRQIAASFDLYLTNYRDLLPEYRALGANAAKLPFATNADYFHPVPARPEYRCDVVVFGRAHRDRVAPVKAVAEVFDLHLYGEAWEAEGLKSRGTLEGEDLLSALNSAKLALVTHTTLFNTPVVKNVMLDFMAAGALVVTNEFEPAREYFDFGKDLIVFGSMADLVDKVRYYLDHPDEAEAIRRTGRERVLREYDWKGFWPGIFRQIAQARGDPLRPDR